MDSSSCPASSGMDHLTFHRQTPPPPKPVLITQTLKDLRKRRSLALYSWVALECVREKKEPSEENEREEEEEVEEAAVVVQVDWVGQAQAVAATPTVHLPCQIVKRDPDLHLRQLLIFMMTWTKRSCTQTPIYFIFSSSSISKQNVIAYACPARRNVGFHAESWLVYFSNVRAFACRSFQITPLKVRLQEPPKWCYCILTDD